MNIGDRVKVKKGIEVLDPITRQKPVKIPVGLAGLWPRITEREGIIVDMNLVGSDKRTSYTIVLDGFKNIPNGANRYHLSKEKLELIS